MRHLIDRLQFVFVSMAAGTLLALFGLVVLQVVMRYGFGLTPYFTSELANFALVWSVLAGTAASVSTGQHIRVAFLSELLGPRANSWLLGLFDLLAAVLFAVLTWAAIRTMGFAIGQTSNGLQIPLVWPYLALPACFAGCLVFSLRRLWRARAAGRHGGAHGADSSASH